mgnify:CR=1 FL=1
MPFSPLYAQPQKLIKAQEMKEQLDKVVSEYRLEKEQKENHIDQRTIDEYETIIYQQINDKTTWRDGKFEQCGDDNWYFLTCDIQLDGVLNNSKELDIIKENLNNNGYFVKVYPDGISVSLGNIEDKIRVVGLNDFENKQFC